MPSYVYGEVVDAFWWLSLTAIYLSVGVKIGTWRFRLHFQMPTSDTSGVWDLSYSCINSSAMLSYVYGEVVDAFWC